LKEIKVSLNKGCEVEGFALYKLESGSVNKMGWLTKSIALFYLNKRPINMTK